MNPIQHGMRPCGACRAYVPGVCAHWKPAGSAAALKSHADRRRRKEAAASARAQRAKAKVAREASRSELLRQLGIKDTWTHPELDPKEET